jgi:hypothetical protein
MPAPKRGVFWRELVAVDAMRFRRVVPVAVIPATLGRHVAHVLGLRSLPKMGRVAADWIIAAVKDEQQSVASIGELPCYAVRGSAAAAVVSATAITSAVNAADPRPAFVGAAFIDL